MPRRRHRSLLYPMLNQHGGKRTPGPGKKIGRPSLPESAKPRTIRLPDSYVEFVTSKFDPELSKAIRLLIEKEMEQTNERTA